MNKKIILIALILGLILISGCVQPPKVKCGDGICQPIERQRRICPQDCKPPISVTETCGPNNKGYCIDFKEKCKTGYEGIGPDTCKAGRSAECCAPVKAKKTCSQQDGTICSSSQTCSGSWLDAADTNRCCSRQCQTIKPPVIDYEDSPFGIFGPYEWKLDTPNVASATDINSYLKDIGAKWIQEMYFTKELENAPDDINIYSRVGREGNNQPPYTTEDYKKELRKVTGKYKEKIKYWEVYTEPSSFPPPMGWKGYAKEYANHLKETYQIIKEECPDCYVVFGGLAGVGTGFDEDAPQAEFLKDVLEAGSGKYFDVFEFKQHNHKASDYVELKNKMVVYGKILSDYGIDIEEIPVFIETAMYDGDPYYPYADLPPQTESHQAEGLVKTYVSGVAVGIDKIFWNLIIERHNFSGNPDNPFNFYGLVHNPANDGHSHKKLSYYSYKLMVEKLEGSDWNNIETIQESDDLYVYKFTKKDTGKPIWIAWDDKEIQCIKAPCGRQITISGIGSNQIKITGAVPKYSSGEDITNYKDAFSTETKMVSNGKITITLGQSPLFLEGQ